MSYMMVKKIRGFPMLCRVRDEKQGNRTVQVTEEFLGKIKIQESKQRQKQNTEQPVTNMPNKKISWDMLRSYVYIRDKGICWVCNKFAKVNDFDGGHIIDRCNGGYDDFDNVVVMHKRCNGLKPYHETLDESLRWKLTSSVPINQDTKPTIKRSYPNKTKRSITLQPIDTNSYTPPKELLNPDDTASRFNLLNHKTVDTTPQVIEIQQEGEKGFSYRHYKNGHYGYKSRHIKQRNTRVSIKSRLPKSTKPNLLAKIVPNTICWIQGRPTGGAMWKVLPPPYNQDDIFTIRQTPPGAIDNGLSDIRQTIQIIKGTLSQVVNISLGRVDIHIVPNPNNEKPSITFSNSSQANIGTRSKTVGLGIGQIPLEKWYIARAKGISFTDFKAGYFN